MATVDKFKGTAISDKIGKVKVKPVRLEYEQGFRPIQPPGFAVPYHNQELLSKHLQKLRDDGVIEDVDPREPIDCILNIALSEKKNKDIRMNIDVRPTRGPRCQEITSPLHKRSITRSEEPSSTLRWTWDMASTRYLSAQSSGTT